MLLIYTHKITNRVKYTFNVIFNSVLGIDFEITSDPEKFKQHHAAKISYTKQSLADEIHYESEKMLFEEGINTPPLSPRRGAGGEADVFALTFFLSTRYEEYLPFEADKYGRFSAKQSYAYKNNFLDKPVVNMWAKEIREKLSIRFPDLAFPENKYSHTPTIDIDNAYAYLGKNNIRTIGGYVKSMLNGDMADILKRKNVLSGKENDPYDTYDFQFEIHKKYNLKPIYFFLLGDWAPNDKNLPHTNVLMLALIKNISGKAETGIHPSFASNLNPEKVKVEKDRLREITPPPSPSRGGQAAKSRQHFLMLKFPQTYRNLIAAGITDDYTMGFADEIGFRAGICTPYKWYDLIKEEETNLTIHPFAIMDGTLNSYLKLSPEQAIEKVKQIIGEIKNVHGELITIWHNETLSDWRGWKGWKNVYEEMIKEAHPNLPEGKEFLGTKSSPLRGDKRGAA